MKPTPVLRWYQNKEQLRNEYAKHGSLAGAARATGVAQQTLSVWWRKLGLPKLSDGHAPATPPIPDGTQTAALLRLLGKNPDLTVHELSDKLDVSPRVVRDLIEELASQGHVFDIKEERVSLRTLPLPTDVSHNIDFEGELYRFGICSDTHLGSKHARVDALNAAYDRFEAEGIETVYHPGDLVCGLDIYRGQVNDIALHSYKDQVDFAAETFPTRKGIVTHIIGGNHDLEGAFGKVGANPVLAVCGRREDMIYGGDFRASYVTPQGASIYLIHPKGGKSYAISYKPQKLVESFLGGTKPSIAIMGHYHDAGFFWARSVGVIMAGCFEGGGNLGYRLFMGEPALGFWIVEMKVSDDGTVRDLHPRWFPIYHEKEG